MFRNILSTIYSRILISLFTLIIVLLNARYLNADNLGTIALIMIAIAILQLAGNLIGGGALVYLLPRRNLKEIYWPSVTWAVFTTFAGTWTLKLFHLIPEGYEYHVFFLSLIFSLFSVNFLVLTSEERIRSYNIISFLQAFILFAVLLFLFIIEGYCKVEAYLDGLYISYSFALVSSFVLIIPSFRIKKGNGKGSVLREMIHMGSVMQAGNILQFLNYRLSYYFIEFFLKRPALGVYSVAVQLTESIWLVSKSMQLVQFARITNEKDEHYASKITLDLVKVSFIFTLFALTIVMALLHLFFYFIFKPAYSQVPFIMYILSGGILVFSISINLSPYFSGMGKPIHNTIGALIGLVFTVGLGLYLIPEFKLQGAALAATIAYFASTLYLFVVFIRKARVRPSDFLLKKADIEAMTDFLRKVISERSK